MEKIKIGRIVNAVALRGEVKVYNYPVTERDTKNWNKSLSKIRNTKLKSQVSAADGDFEAFWR